MTGLVPMTLTSKLEIAWQNQFKDVAHSGTLMIIDQSKRTAIGFVLTIYRKRLSSSFAALARSLQGRLDRQVDDDQFDLEEGGEEVDADEVKGNEDVARRLLESAAIRDILADLETLPIDTKAQALRDELTRLAAERYTQFKLKSLDSQKTAANDTAQKTAKKDRRR